ncbi:probable cytochrome P450 49a1 [Penaeus monodon]|uniref:probable cytochrome P450 49a1 n=1 Tax=Penaeus monodon TaxID=6687 RepID=UPI0018A6FC07|nr:probable cytochrome P450 49a1 [Penaeus monodon]
MLRHPAFDPTRVYLFWQALAQEFGPIFRKDMPGHPNMVFISNPEDVCAMFEATRRDPVRPGLTSLKKIREEGRRARERRERGESRRERERGESRRERGRGESSRERERGDGGRRTREEDEERRKREDGCPRAGVFDGGAGILAEQGEEWWRVRRRVQKPITDAALVSRYLPDMDDVARAFVRRIRSLRDKENEVPATFVNEIYKWAIESLATVVLERRLHCIEDDLRGSPESSHLIPLAKQFLDALYETENVKLWQYFPTTSITRLKDAHDVFSEIALRAIEDTERALASCRRGRDEPRRLSLLENLLETPGLSRGDVITFLIDLLATGIDTTSHSVSHMLYLLAKNPEVQGRVIREVDAEVGKPEHLSPEHIARLTYTRAAFRETLRIMPVGIGITRKLNRDTVLGGYLVPKGWQVVVPSMLINHKDSIFPRASEFLPERFLRGSPLAPTHSYAFLPFSVGTRMCIGRRVAQQEIMCLMIRILGEFTVVYKHEDIHLINKLSYRPSHPLRFTFNDRI